jgi:hypothetical protein
VLAVIAATAGRDCGYRIVTRREENRTHNQAAGPHLFTICSTRDGHTDAAPAMMSSLFRFPSVASKPRFSHDPVNLAPDCTG